MRVYDLAIYIFFGPQFSYRWFFFFFFDCLLTSFTFVVNSRRQSYRRVNEIVLVQTVASDAFAVGWEHRTPNVTARPCKPKPVFVQKVQPLNMFWRVGFCHSSLRCPTFPYLISTALAIKSHEEKRLGRVANVGMDHCKASSWNWSVKSARCGETNRPLG